MENNTQLTHAFTPHCHPVQTPILSMAAAASHAGVDAPAASSPPEWRVARRGGVEAHTRTHLGEGALWSVRDQCLYWTDIERCTIHRYVPPAVTEEASLPALGSSHEIPGGTHTHVQFGSMVGCIALTEMPGQILLAAASGLWLFDWGSLQAWLVAPFPESADGYRFNDGAVTPQGTLLVGTLLLDESKGKGLGTLWEYRCDPETGEIVQPARKVLSGLAIPNGIDWSADSKRMFFIDTPRGRVDQFDFSSSASADHASVLSHERAAFPFVEGEGHPDGLCVDAGDAVWVAAWDGARVTQRMVPRTQGEGEAKLLRTIALPTGQTTCPCFGGPQLRDLYVTSASRGVDFKKQPLAGSLFVIHNAGQGKQSFVFKGKLRVDQTKAVKHTLVVG